MVSFIFHHTYCSINCVKKNKKNMAYSFECSALSSSLSGQLLQQQISNFLSNVLRNFNNGSQCSNVYNQTQLNVCTHSTHDWVHMTEYTWLRAPTSSVGFVYLERDDQLIPLYDFIWFVVLEMQKITSITIHWQKCSIDVGHAYSLNWDVKYLMVARVDCAGERSSWESR